MADIIDPYVSLKDMIRLQGEKDYEYVDRKTALKSDFIRKAYNSTRKLCKRGCRSVSISLYDKLFWGTTMTYLDFLRVGSLQCAHWTWDIAIDLYHLGEAVDDVDFRDAVIDLMFVKYRKSVEDAKRWLPDEELIIKVYKYAEIGSPLRQFIVDIHIWASSAGPEREKQSDDEESDNEADSVPEIPKKFFKDLIESKMAQDGIDLASFAKVLISNGAKATLETAPTIDLEADATHQTPVFPSGVSVCDYHVHEPGALCANRKRKRAAEDCAT